MADSTTTTEGQEPEEGTTTTGEKPTEEAQNGSKPSGDSQGSDLSIDKLPESVQKYIKDLRTEAAERRTTAVALQEKVTEFEREKMTEAERLEARAKDAETRAQTAETQLMRHTVAAEKGIPAAALDFLTGSSREELEQSADKLKTLIVAGGTTPPPDFGNGARPNGGTDGDGDFNSMIRRAAGRSA